MGPFLRKTVIALFITALFHVAAGFFADGTTDEYYLRFTTDRQRSLILGGSRAAQGVHPSVFNDVRDPWGFDGPMYNFAFTMAHSPYGATYLHAIKEKLDTSGRDGLFILQVDPWLLSNTADSTVEAEADRTLGHQWTWTMRPNYEYLIRYWDRGWGALGHWPMGDPDTSAVLMPDGRLAVNVAMDPPSLMRRMGNKMDNYGKEYLPGRMISPDRMSGLRKTVELLKPHGTVVLVRLPVGKEIARMEGSFAPDMATRLQAIAKGTGAVFIDLDTIAGATFTDGIHLDGPSGLRMTGILRKAIQDIIATRHR